VKPGVKVFDLCVRGDSFVEECVRGRVLAAVAVFILTVLTSVFAPRRETGKAFNKAKTKDGEKVKKGSAFPTCISINKCV